MSAIMRDYFLENLLRIGFERRDPSNPPIGIIPVISPSNAAESSSSIFISDRNAS